MSNKYDKLLKPWHSRLFLKKISWLMILSTGVLLIALSGFSVYGDNVGDLVVSVNDYTAKALSLSEVGEFGASDSSAFLSAEGIKGVRDSTYYYIPEEIREGNGLKSDKETNLYFAYSFYLKNMSDVSIGYIATLKIDQQTNGIDKAARIMILVDNEEPLIFARPKSDGTAEELEDDEGSLKKGYTTIPFTENECVAIDDKAMEVDEVQKYTIVLWLEGWDWDCNDSILGGKLAISLTFQIIG